MKRAGWELVVWSACRTLYPLKGSLSVTKCREGKIEKRGVSLAIASPDRGLMNVRDWCFLKNKMQDVRMLEAKKS